MSELDQMRNRLANAFVVVDAYRVDLGKSRSTIHNDQRHGVGRKFFEHRGLASEHHHGHAINLALQHTAHRHGDAGWVVGRRGEQDFVTVLDGELLEALDKLGKKRVGNLRDHEADDVAAAGHKRARLRIGLVVELAYRAPDALGHLAVNAALLVGDAGDGGDGDTGPARDVADIHPCARLRGFRALLHAHEYRGSATVCMWGKGQRISLENVSRNRISMRYWRARRVRSWKAPQSLWKDLYAPGRPPLRRAGGQSRAGSPRVSPVHVRKCERYRPGERHCCH